MPKSIYGYIWRVSGRAQIGMTVLAVIVFLLDLVPLELQRRIVNDALGHRHLALLATLAGIYAAAALIQGLSKFALNLFRTRIGESATRRLRLDTRAVALCHPPEAGREGVGISIILSEVEPVGGFVGTAVSDPVLHTGILLSVFSYLLYLQPWMALVSLGFLVPQFVFVPLLQEAINRRAEKRIQVMRYLSVEIVNETVEGDPEGRADDFPERVGDVYRLNMQIYRRKYSMNFLINLLHHFATIGVLMIGGWFVIDGQIEVGTVVAFLSGLKQVKDPWSDVVNYFREMTNARVKYHLIADALDQSAAAAADAQAVDITH